MAKINGTWCFNSEFGAVEFDQVVNFTSNGQTFDRMACLTDTSTLTNAPHLYYYSGDTAVLAGEGYVFTDTAYKTVEFGESSQEVSMTYLYFMDSSGYAQNGRPTLNGIWRFKETISFEYSEKANVSFIDVNNIKGSGITFSRSLLSTGGWSYEIKYTETLEDLAGEYTQDFTRYSSSNGWTKETLRYVGFHREQQVSHLFYEIFTSNADDVTDTTISIFYNNKLHAALRVGYGDKATIPCAGLVMKTDISILGPASVPTPIEIATETEMTALLETAEVGSVYKYTGETGIYENGALYVVEESA